MQLPNSVMIIDDDEDDRKLFFEALMEVEPSCHFMSAENGRTALEIVQRSNIALPDLIFLDWNMPVMDGMQCLSHLRELEILNSIPVIIYTTSPFIENIERLKMFAPVYFLTKPTKYKDIVRLLSYLLTNKWWDEEKAVSDNLIRIK